MMKLVRGWVVASAAVAATLIAAPAARGDGCEAETAAVKAVGRPDPALSPPTDPEAKRHMGEGNKRHRVQEYAQAVEEYKAGALIEGAPVFLYNLGQAYRLGGDYEKAILQYRLFLDRGAPGPELRALVECHVRAMTRELDQAASREQPTGPAPDDGGAIGEGEDDRVPPTEIGPVPAAPRRGVAAPWYADGLGWGISGGGAIASAIGAVLLLDASSLDDQAATEDREDVRTELRDRADSRRLWGTVVGGVGVAALAVGVVKLVLTPDAAEQPSGGNVRLIASPRSFGLAWTF
ncbi:MAG: hypothetical protein KC464_05230 [Myxococcales bacterium]|nr:hypothetical protein [Myxococcales bacterium]